MKIIIGENAMTMLASWIGVDSHGTTSAYIMSESRFTWSIKNTYDYGKKVFASKRYPELFGYVGEVLFPSIVLSQIIEMIDTEILLKESMSCECKHKVISEKICYSLSKYSDVFGGNTIQIVHITRDTIVEGYPSFHTYLLEYGKDKVWRDQKISMPEKSGVIKVLGSGAKEFNENYNRFQHMQNSSTSRNVYQCFVDTLTNIKDPCCGGAPQLVGLYRKPLSAGINYGILYKKKRYLLGMEIPQGSMFENVDWRNELFEICDGRTKQIVPGAARQPKPSSII